MKKTIIGLVAASLLTITAFSRDQYPNPSVLQAFQTDFKHATNVEWQERRDFVKVNFIFNGSRVEAYYELDGELIGTARTILFDQLPVVSLKEIETRFPGSAFYDLTEYDKRGEIFYMLTVEQGSKKLTVRVFPSGDVTVEKKSGL
jgi:hypothetical protein